MDKIRALIKAVQDIWSYGVYLRKNCEKKPVIMVSHEFSATGASLLFANIHKALQEREYAVIILTANTATCPLSAILRPDFPSTPAGEICKSEV